MHFRIMQVLCHCEVWPFQGFHFLCKVVLGTNLFGRSSVGELRDCSVREVD